ncbi:phage terminase small subunit [Paenibacillus tianmuensis]|uniref:Phage terminase small subunit n=1 Tax=Paenibacillus tianmuensis TaxID=624147 RepID=A0A1G4TY07_9BACL|nr:terminase small subunit [Paenibacillus tianmuensis]SCW86217.1 phage terminase small subunit [Paenibacillus tianmuensis]
MKSAKPTQKQRVFVDLYIETGNATQSYIDAGYSATTRSVADGNARKLLQKPAVKEYLEERMAQKDGERIAKQDEILEFLTKVMRGQVDEEFPLGVGMGEQSLVKKELDGKDRIKAAELLGKRYMMWTDHKQVDVKGAVQIVDDIPKRNST